MTISRPLFSGLWSSLTSIEGEFAACPKKGASADAKTRAPARNEFRAAEWPLKTKAEFPSMS